MRLESRGNATLEWNSQDHYPNRIEHHDYTSDSDALVDQRIESPDWLRDATEEIDNTPKSEYDTNVGIEVIDIDHEVRRLFNTSSLEDFEDYEDGPFSRKLRP